MKSCASCSKKVRVENVSSFRKGQHIALPGQKSRTFVEHTHTLIHLYQHHAIIKEIRQTSGTRIEMELIHFSKEGWKKRIFQSVKTYDLAHDELYIIEYTHPRYNAEKIVERAESMLPDKDNEHKFGRYCPLTNNCEHLATWCVVGERESFQCQSMWKRFANFMQRLFVVGTKIAKMVLRVLFTSLKKIAACLTNGLFIPEFLLGGIAVVYLIYCIIKSILLYRNRGLCKTCFKRKLLHLWTSFAVFCATSTVTFVVFNLALSLNPLAIIVIISLILLSELIHWSVPKILKALQSPFDVDKKRIKQLSEIDVGDVVLLSCYKTEHAVIVTEVHEDQNSPLKGQIRVVHYGSRSFFGTREIMEEYFTIDLEKEDNIIKKKTMKFDCSHILTYAPEKTVMLARKRIGEKKWALTSNRSDHLCYWAKVQPRPRSICINWDNGDLGPSSTKDLSSLYLSSTEVHLENDLHLGDVIKYEKTGILVGKEVLNIDTGRQLRIEMIVYYWKRYFSKKTYTVDLNKDGIIVKHYHPAHCIPMAERKDRANKLEGRKGTWWTNKGFIKHCIMSNP